MSIQKAVLKMQEHYAVQALVHMKNHNLKCEYVFLVGKRKGQKCQKPTFFKGNMCWKCRSNVKIRRENLRKNGLIG